MRHLIFAGPPPPRRAARSLIQDLPAAELISAPGLLRRAVTAAFDSILDCSALITRQLAELAVLASRLRACAREHESTRLLRELSNRAVLHVLSRERILLPAWRRARWRGLPLEAMTAHVRLKQALADLIVLRPTDERFADALSEFAAHVQSQQALDHERLIPVLRDVMGVDERRELCNDMELLFDAGDAPVRAESPAGPSPRELIREAEIVLSSLARGTAAAGPPSSATAAG